MNIRFTLSKVLVITLAVYAFVLTLLVAPYHINGDQIWYTKAYEAMKGLNLVEALKTYRKIIYSVEPVHFFVSWALANLGFDKIIAMAMLNGLLAALFGIFLLRRSHSYIIVVLLVVSNYYMYAMFFTLEKLKISIIFLLIFVNYRIRLSGILAGLSHLQVGILFVIHFASRFLSRIRLSFYRKSFNLRTIVRVVVLALIAAGSSLVFYDYALAKFYFYISRDAVGHLSSIIPALIVLIATFFTADQKRMEVVWYFAILALGIFVIGSDRLNMFALFGFLYFTSYRLRLSLNGIVFLSAVFVSTLYLGYKSYRYLDMVVKYGG